MLLSEDWFGYSVVFSVLTISSFNIFYYLQYSPPWPSFLNYIIYTVLLCDLPPLKPHWGEAPGRDSNPGRAVYRHLPLDPPTATGREIPTPTSTAREVPTPISTV